MSTEAPTRQQPQSLSALSRGSGPGAPAVPRPPARWKTRVLVPLAILLAVGGVLLYAARGVLVPAVEVRVVPVVMRTAAAGAAAAEPTGAAGPARSSPSGAAVVQAPGWIEPDPFAVSVPALVEGVVQEVLVLEGQAVEAGQVVARLIDADLVLEEEAAGATVTERDADVRRAEAALAQARARAAVDRSAAAAARDEVTRKKDLVAGGGLSPGEFRRMELRLEGLEAQVTAAESSVAEAEAALVQAQAAKASAEVQLRHARLRRERTEVRSPRSGVVLSLLVKPGMRMSMGAAGASEVQEAGVVTLYDPSKLQVRTDVPLSDAGKVSVGTRAEITTEALPNTTFAGVVTRVVHEANIQRNTVQYKVAIEGPSPLLKPEMLARVRFYGAPAAAPSGDPGPSGAAGAGGLVAVLPGSVLVNRQEGSARVWIAEDAGGASGTRAALREVALGSADGDDVVIASGVKPGDRAIVDPPPGLRPGTRVRIVGEAAAEPTN